MKKIVLILIAMALLLAIPGRVHAVTLEPDCTYVYNLMQDTPPGVDDTATQLLSVLSLLMSDLPTDAWAADIEMRDGEMVGDKVPDMFQMGMLGAVLCSGEPTILAQFNDNLAAFNSLFGNIYTALGQAALVAQTGIELAAQAAPGDPGADPPILGCGPLERWIIKHYPDTQSQEYVDGMAAAALIRTYSGEIQTFAGQYGMIFGLLGPAVVQFFTDMSGLSTEMVTTFTGLFGDLMTMLAEETPNMTAAANAAYAYRDIINTHLQTAHSGEGEGEGECPNLYENDLRDGLDALGDGINTLVTFLTGIPLPTLVVYDRPGSKALNEDFAAWGDYNDDGALNIQVYDQVIKDHPSPFYNDQQRIRITYASGTDSFNVGFHSQFTAELPWNVSAATLQAALEGLAPIGAGNVTVVQSQYTPPTADNGVNQLDITFVNALGLADQEQFEVNTTNCNSLVMTLQDGGRNLDQTRDIRADYVYWATCDNCTFLRLPVAGGLGLALLASVCAMGGALAMRRKK